MVDATALRDRLDLKLDRLAELIESTINELPANAVTTKELMNMFRLLGGYRGLSEAIVVVADVPAILTGMQSGRSASTILVSQCWPKRHCQRTNDQYEPARCLSSHSAQQLSCRSSRRERRTRTIPKEFDMFGVYLPPMLLVVALAAAAVATAHLLNRLRVTRFIAAPPLFLMDMVYAVFFSTFIIRA